MKDFRKLFFVLLVLPAIVLSGCKKDKDEEPVPTGPVTQVTTSISGIVIDEYGYPLSGVTVTVGTRTVTTAYDGAYYFYNVTVPIKRYAVKFEKSGYFDVVRSGSPAQGTMNEMEVGMISHTSFTYAGNVTFNSASSQTFYVGSTQCQIDFPANAWVVESTGAVYSGDVTVYAAYLDPTLPNYSKFVFGGDCIGLDSTGAEVMLDPYAGLAVEITGTSGEELNLNPTTKATATVSFKIPDALVASSPSIIDMWSFNVTAGYAGTGGSASKQGDKYVGEVQHFSFWSCERNTNGKATVTGYVKDSITGQPVPGVIVNIGRTYAITDADGKFTKVVAAGIPLSVGVRPGFQGLYLAPVVIGPLSLDENYTMTSDLLIPTMRIVTGRLVGCTGNGVLGKIICPYSGGVATCLAKPDGTFRMVMPMTVSFANFYAYGNNTNQSTSYFSLTTNPYDIGDISLCPPIQTGPNDFTINGTTYNTFTQKSGHVEVDSDDGAYPDSGRVFIDISNTTMPYTSMYIHFKGRKTGTISLSATKDVKSSYVSVYDGSQSYMINGSMTITKFSVVGGLIEGTFTGTGPGSETISGHFSVQREADVPITF